MHTAGKINIVKEVEVKMERGTEKGRHTAGISVEEVEEKIERGTEKGRHTAGKR